jgi:hypothetical protein
MHDCIQYNAARFAHLDRTFSTLVNENYVFESIADFPVLSMPMVDGRPKEE